MTERLYNAYQVAALLGVSSAEVVQWIQKGWIPVHRQANGSIRIRERGLVEFLRQRGIDLEAILAKAVLRESQGAPGNGEGETTVDSMASNSAERQALPALQAQDSGEDASEARRSALFGDGKSTSELPSPQPPLPAEPTPRAGETPAELADRMSAPRAGETPTPQAQTPAPFADLGLSEPESALLGGVLARPARLVVVAGLTPSGRLSTVRALAARASEPHRDTVVVGRRSGPEIVAVQRVVGEGESFDATAMEALSRGGGVVALEDVRHRRLFRSAVESALEGPLVIASMPAGGAAEALGLLLEALGESEESRWDLAACLGAVVVHRTVRLLCPHCREEVAAPAEALAKLGAPSDAGTRCSRPVGCDRCSGSGYAGTGGIVSIETLAGQPTRLLRAGAPIAEVEAAAAKGCIRTLLQAGLERVRAGQTSLAELARVL